MKIDRPEMTNIVVKQDPLEDPQVRDLVALHLEDMHKNSPQDSVYALDLSNLQQPGVTVWTAWMGDQAAAIGALNEVDKQTGEIKSMRTHPDFLRMGIAGQVLEHIITVAQSRSYTRLCLETGSGQTFDAALGLYRKRGFAPCDAFGAYEKSDFNQFFALEL